VSEDHRLDEATQISQVNRTQETLRRSPSIPESESSEQEDLVAKVKRALQGGTDYLFAEQNEDYHWCAELESNSTITSEYVFLAQILGLDLADRREKMVAYLLHHQKKDGSWGIAAHFDGDVSSTAETYLALRILGLEVSHPALVSAQNYILTRGGLEKVRIFTRIHFALFGLIPWEAIPAIPPEFIFFPPQMPVNIYSLSSWARGTMVPLFIIFHHKPVFALPNGKDRDNRFLDHLWLDPADKRIPYAPSLSELIVKTMKREGSRWRTLFAAADRFLKFYEKRGKSFRVRAFALKKCESWILEHQEKSGDWAGIFPPMVNSVLALTLQGYALDSDPVKRGIEAIDRFAWEDELGYRIQACVSPVWDTALAAIGLVDAGVEGSDAKLKGAIDWILERQLVVEYGDWKVYNPDGPSGGWSFEYQNSWYPDVDDTAAVVLALLKQDPTSATTPAMKRAIGWMVSMQNRDGGWAAFDINNDHKFLNEIPFSDMNSLCDDSSPDVTGRVLEALGLLRRNLGDALARHYGEASIQNSIDRGVDYLKRTQEIQGSWYGRWGVNYVYGTSNVLCGLSQIEPDLKKMTPEVRSMIERGTQWLKLVQNEDGGFGESLESYSDKRWMGKGESTASQTAWGAMGLLSYLSAQDPAVQNAIRYLLRKQRKMGISGLSWKESHFTGTGFPNHFYLRYHYYRHYFPMMALGRFHRALQN
jgi:squalene-hopene/tetraprenyl-beta-curcumene cyclase